MNDTIFDGECHPIKVVRDVVKDQKTGKNRKVTYRDVKYDADKWVDAKFFLPADFDLVHLKTKDKTYSGWAMGNKWDGLKHKLDSEVFYWKRQD